MNPPEERPVDSINEMYARETEEDRIGDLKLEINNLIWMHGPDSLTLKDAEQIALTIYEMIAYGKKGASDAPR